MFDVKHIAKLARLGLSAQELAKIQKELSSIFDFFKELEQVDVSDVKPTSHAYFLENIVREDVAKKQLPKTVAQLVKSAPETKNRYVKVKPIL
ncbi:Asp-tRNA(Asn)/Glu-tRNA(Gln) amidotransferase subunit GatC [Candidatus Parcubacteria bacterium]|jgi:aspartyl-tRNA(Asn)/glutamyl-tRNA(Gln) amidotransferase subunit C|nr:Asp-tRNA(Asn)/Glu-tRNA(Gln) amidotransferase subunit GatC [Candidatus Parcubacteria bacterium]